MCKDSLNTLPSTCIERPCLEDVVRWRYSFDNLLSNKAKYQSFHRRDGWAMDGLAAFWAFLKTEFSNENLEFWLACEKYKKIRSTTKLSSKAQEIYEQFIQNEACREVNIDHHTKEVTQRQVAHATHNCFDVAQEKIWVLKEKDSYPRFLRF
ncbi:hypothetical protein NDU88_003893 [Pleurodeles waltl]|uniref:Regulator of G-protein signaling 8 n=1 Tax=Pleurodeles waltl TaxID=8319 RepID=A0AAV7T695_PLEWA|nr:hypothetical protein NDU88_003893 [Pleurodeles waltl]